MNRLSKHHFWEWFKRHNQEYSTLMNRPKKEAAYWLNELNAHLRAYYKFLGFSLECGKQISTLTITVNGNVRHFKKVEQLVAKAAKMPGWRIVALEDPRSINFLLEPLIEETGIDPAELYFSFTSSMTLQLEITVYHPLCTVQNRDIIYQLADKAIYNLLGERSYGMNIDRLKVDNLSNADRKSLEKLEALPGCLDQHSSHMMIDRQGHLICLN